MTATTATVMEGVTAMESATATVIHGEMAMTAMVMDGDGDGWRDGNAKVVEGTMATQRQ